MQKEVTAEKEANRREGEEENNRRCEKKFSRLPGRGQSVWEVSWTLDWNMRAILGAKLQCVFVFIVWTWHKWDMAGRIVCITSRVMLSSVFPQCKTKSRRTCRRGENTYRKTSSHHVFSLSRSSDAVLSVKHSCRQSDNNELSVAAAKHYCCKIKADCARESRQFSSSRWRHRRAVLHQSITCCGDLCEFDSHI